MRDKFGRFLKGHNIGYQKGHKTNIGRKCSEETKQKISNILKGRRCCPLFSNETRKKISLANKGKKRLPRTEEYKLKMSLSKKGQIPWIKGKHHSIETRRLISIKTKKAMNIPEMKEKLSKVNSHPAWNKGIPCRKETKKKLSFINRQYKHTNEAIKKIRFARLNQTFPLKDTSIEVVMQNKLRENNINFITHKPILGQPDIFIEPNICIFCDGDYWHNLPKQIERDKRINDYLRQKGYKIFRFWEKEINSDIIFCINTVLEALPLMQEEVKGV